MEKGLYSRLKGVTKRDKQYADYLKEYEKKLNPIRKERLNKAKEAKRLRKQNGIDISIPNSNANQWNPKLTSPDSSS